MPRVPSIPSVASVALLARGVGGAAASILSSAAAYWKAKDYSGSGALLDGSGNGHDAQLGSISGADSNDPLFLEYVSADGKYLYLPGSANNYASVPDSVALSITGDIDIRVKAALEDWTPGGLQCILGKATGAGNRSFLLWLDSAQAGKLTFTWYEAGDTPRAVTSSAAPTVADGSALWVRVTLDVNNGSGGHTVTFYTSSDGTTWAQLGTTQSAGAFTTSIADSTSSLDIGNNTAATGYLTGKVYRVQLFASTDGTDARLDADFNQAAEPYSTFSEVSSNMGTVTINRSSSGRKACLVDRDRFLLGTDDYAEVADAANLDFAAAESLSATVRFRVFGTPAANQVLLAKKADLSTGAGWALYLDTLRRVVGLIADGTNTTSVTSAALTAGQEYTATLVRDVANDQISLLLDGTQVTPVTDTTTGTLANAEVLRFGRLSGAGTSYLDAEFVAASLIRAVIDTTQNTTLAGELIA